MSYNPQNPNGQAPSADSAPVVIASDQSAVPVSAGNLPLPSGASTSADQTNGSQKTQVVNGSGSVIGSTSNALNVNISSGSVGGSVELTDGTNTANVLNPGNTPAGQNAQLVAPTGYSVNVNLNSTTTASNWYDCLSYPWISVEILSNASTAALTFQTSGDASETNVRTTPLVDSQATTGTGANSSTSAIATLYGPRTGRYFRVSSNLTSSNTASVTITFYTSAASLTTMGVFVPGSNTTGVAVPSSAFYMAANSGGNLTGVGAISSPSDGTTNSSVAMATFPYNMVYNGTTWDRVREAPTASGTSGTGLLGAGAMGIYNSSAPSANSGDYYPLQLDSSANLKVNVAASSGLTVLPGNTANTTPWLTSLNPATSGGWSVSSQTALSNTVVAVKTSTGQLGGYMFYNPAAGTAYIQVFNAATGSVTLGTTAPTYVIPIPGGGAANVEFANGIAHGTSISVAATSTATGLSAPTSSLVGFVLYK